MRNLKKEKKYRRHKRVRAKLFGTADRPRLCVFRSLKHIYAQLINDDKGKTLISVSDLGLKKVRPKINLARSKKEDGIKKPPEKLTQKIVVAFEVGKLIAEKSLKNKIEKVVFDRGSSAYHGRVKALAEGAREGGLKF